VCRSKDPDWIHFTQKGRTVTLIVDDECTAADEEQTRNETRTPESGPSLF
jgi:hypothetical protein